MKKPTGLELEGLKRELKTIALAMRAFESAAALSKHIQEGDFATQNGFLYSALMAGLVVTYMHPFKESGQKRGVDELPTTFNQFDSPRFEKAHRELAMARNKLYAHTDVIYGPKVRVEYESDVVAFETLISFRQAEGGKFEIIPSVNVPEIAPKTLSVIAELVELQLSRALAEAARILRAMAAGYSYDANKVYRVGIDFP